MITKLDPQDLVSKDQFSERHDIIQVQRAVRNAILVLVAKLNSVIDEVNKLRTEEVKDESPSQ